MEPAHPPAESSRLFLDASGNPGENFLAAHRAQTQDGAGLRLRSLPERIEEELHSLTNGFVGRTGLDVCGVLPSRARDVDGHERQDNSVWHGLSRRAFPPSNGSVSEVGKCV